MGTVRLKRSQIHILAVVFAFLGIAVLSIAAIPWYGSGVHVVRPSGGLHNLTFTQENLTQLLYLVFVVLLIASIGITRLDPIHIRRAVRILLLSGVCVAAWGWMQLVMYAAGFPYPDFLFNSNASFAQLYGQQLEGIALKRMSSVAPEPSMFGRFLLIPTVISLLSLSLKSEVILKRKQALLLSLFFSVTLVFTTSSTALIGLVCGLALVAVFMLTRHGDVGKSRALGTRALLYLKTAMPFVLVLLLGLFVIARWWLRLSLEDVADVLNALILAKMQSTSGVARLAGSLYGLRLFAEHPLLGVGWGSNRTFDLLTTVLSTTGLAGLVAFVWMHVTLLRRSSRQWDQWRMAGLQNLCEPTKALALALAVALVGKLLAEPDMIFLDYWVVFSLLIASLGWPSPGSSGQVGRHWLPQPSPSPA